MAFSNISKSTPWLDPYLSFAIENKIISKNDKFRPKDPIHKAELAKILSRTLEVLEIYDGELSSFPGERTIKKKVKRVAIVQPDIILRRKYIS
jgi:hypothetical protein